MTVHQYTDDTLNRGNSPNMVQIIHDRSGTYRILASMFSRVWYNLLESSAAWAWAVTHEAFLFINAQCLRVSGYGPHNTKSLCIGHTERGYQQGLEQQAPDKAQLITPLHLDEEGGKVPGHGVCLGKILC